MKISRPLPTPTNLQDRSLERVRAAIENDPGLTEKRKRQLLSYLDRVAKLLGKHLRDLPLHLPTLSDLLAGVNPVAKGISHKTHLNIRWGLLSAINQSGLKPGVLQDGRSHLTEPWKKLAALLPRLRHRAGMSRL